LRHKFAVEWLKDTGDIYRLQRILGHSSIKTTEIYLDHVDTKVVTDMESLAQKKGSADDS